MQDSPAIALATAEAVRVASSIARQRRVIAKFQSFGRDVATAMSILTLKNRW